MQSDYPLFPLPTTLLPYGKMPLQIFEQRYLKLVKQCMREGSTFGVIQLVKGSEVMKDGRRVPPIVAERGTVAQIVDWDQLPNGLLGITLQGQNTFTASNLRVAEDGLVLCDAEFESELTPSPLLDTWEGLAEVLESLETHPHVERLQLNVDYRDAWQVGYHLLQLLPLDESLKLSLLAPDSLERLMTTLDQELTQLSGE
ncbi:ATP-dependent protease La domain protein [Aequoribacter fuscus]|jgi:Lon protease-like protein|uniref:ATP-dependent protease La domain protein n=1 Tax=Aequoribacter fuscus TaxID=2518989 RepID=F3L318_9GAMM|nr:LON peptidase substrate-binding domain-containing protein [Aequoribacter fuscus]EGG29258.1 ATP-dependent protease La domain protein [Aequoribacter fuscus]QHJ87342.1 ATP-dependent protease [Aequoribacter fuscus]